MDSDYNTLRTAETIFNSYYTEKDVNIINDFLSDIYDKLNSLIGSHKYKLLLRTFEIDEKHQTYNEITDITITKLNNMYDIYKLYLIGVNNKSNDGFFQWERSLDIYDSCYNISKIQFHTINQFKNMILRQIYHYIKCYKINKNIYKKSDL